MSDEIIDRETTYLILGSATVSVLLFLILYQALTPSYSVANRTVIIIAGLIYAFLQVDILGGKLSSSNITMRGPRPRDQHRHERPSSDTDQDQDEADTKDDTDTDDTNK